MKHGTYIRRILQNHYHGYVTRSKQRNLTFNIDIKTFEALCRRNCYYCGSPPTLKKWKYIHVTSGIQVAEDYLNGLDRIDNTIWYELENIVTCCKTCNKMKSDIPLKDFLRHVELISKYL